MAGKTKDHKNHYKVNSRPILNLLIGLGFFTVVILAMMFSASKDNNYQNNRNNSNNPDTQEDNQANRNDSAKDAILAVVTAIDMENQKITLFDVNQQRSMDLKYTGGTNIKDKYGKVKSISQIEIGDMVDVAYDEAKMKLTDLNISTRAWEYAGVNNFSIDLSTKIMKIASTKYRFEDNTFVLNGMDTTSIATLTEQDELTVRGYEETIWSITVTRGHGTVVLEDYEPFLGAFITIGYEAMQQIEDGMEIAVREGNFNLTVENGSYSATKNITIYRNQITNVSLSDLGPAAMQLGRVTFEITPFGADLILDGEYTSYANPLELTYGKHVIEVSLGGYIKYEGILDVDSAGKTIKIDLPETSSSDTVTVTETDNTATDNQGSDPDDSTDADSDNSETDDTNSETGDNNSDTSDDSEGNKLIYVQKPTDASVYIDGEFKCVSPGSFAKITGTHVITFIRDGYKTMSYTIEVADDGLDTYFTFPDLEKE